jgi:predicted anti-sigma-YlaC factor YlaD
MNPHSALLDHGYDTRRRCYQGKTLQPMAEGLVVLHFSVSRAKISAMNSTLIRNIRFPAGYRVVLVFVVVLLISGCGAVRRAQMRSVAEVFSGSPESNVFVRDNDPELIRDALPFALKTYEALLASDAKNRELYLAAADGFVTYANAFIHAEAEREKVSDFQRAQYLRQRATKLYLRGRNYAIAGLAIDHPDFEKKLCKNSHQILGTLSPKDVPLLYWAAAGWAGAISTMPSNMTLVAELPIVEAMMRRALALDEDFNDGAIHEFFVTYEGSRLGAMGGSAQRAVEHFDHVLTVTQGKKASPYVALASSVAVGKQDYKLFKELLHKALAVDPDAVLKWRLANILAQQRAQWLLHQSPELFLDYEETEP